MNVDGAVSGGARVTNFDQNFNRLCGEVVNYKNPQFRLLEELLKYVDQVGRRVAYVFDLKTSDRVDELVCAANAGPDYEALKVKLWELLGRQQIVPAVREDVRLFDDVRQQDQLQRVEVVYDDARDRREPLKQVMEQLGAFVAEQGCFEEFAEFAGLRATPGFSFAGSTFTRDVPGRERTARVWFGAKGVRSYTFVAPRTLGTADLKLCGREAVNFMLFRSARAGERVREAQEALQRQFLEWVESAVLQHFAAGKLRFLDASKYTRGQLDKVPDKLRLYATMEDKDRYGPVIALNEAVRPRKALGVSEAAKNVSDSDDSEVDEEAGSGVQRKPTPEQRKALQDKLAAVRGVFAEAYPERQKSRKGRKGKSAKGKRSASRK